MNVVNADIAGAIYLSVQLFVNIVIFVALCLKMMRMEATLVENYLNSNEATPQTNESWVALLNAGWAPIGASGMVKLPCSVLDRWAIRPFKVK
jgi:hypothetical protein